jgi:hypothetical protein
MKKLYKFSMTQEIEDTETVVSKDEEGNEVKTTKPTRKNVTRQFFIRKPTRKMYDEAELYYGVKLSEGIKAGMMTRALMAKRFDNDGGVLSEEDKKRYSAQYFTLFELQNEYQRLSLIEKATRTEEQQEKLNTTIKAMIEIKERIQDFESAQQSIFDQTAENRARNKTIMWWTLMLAHEEALDEEINETSDLPYFGTGDIGARLDSYDDMEENEDQDEFSAEVMRKFAYFVSFWYVGKAGTKEEFEQLASSLTESEIDSERRENDIDDVIASEQEKMKEMSEELDEMAEKTDKAVAEQEELEAIKEEPEEEKPKPKKAKKKKEAKEDKPEHKHEDGTVHSHEGGEEEHTHKESKEGEEQADTKAEGEK